MKNNTKKVINLRGKQITLEELEAGVNERLVKMMAYSNMVAKLRKARRRLEKSGTNDALLDQKIEKGLAKEMKILLRWDDYLVDCYIALLTAYKEATK